MSITLFKCDDPNCKICTFNSATSSAPCDECKPFWNLIMTNHTCKSLCGDGGVVGAEECDDKNLQNSDGCSN